ncbi:MAG: ABC transporter substrate-binding protein [Clostridia bacterium]|nr:ABC transporter substrate-binding protein [Clostridia bacterium]
MKKIFSISIALIFCLLTAVSFVGCSNSDIIRMNEVTHSVFYAPLYVAINKGYMEEEGLKIELTSGQGSDVSMSALLSGNADIALLGPETVVYVHAQGSTNHPMIFGQLTKRDGSFLVSRTPIDNFNWQTSLTNKTVIAGRRGGMPAMTFEWVVNSNGLYNGNNITLDLDTAFAQMVPTFQGGAGDFCTMFEPTATEYQNKGLGTIVASVGEYSGEIPYTCFMASKNFMNKYPDKIDGFLRAIKKAYTFIMTATSEEVATALAPSFDGSTIASLQIAVESYKRIDAWMATPAMTESSYNRLLSVLKNAGTLSNTSIVNFTDVVDNSHAIKI